MYIWLYMYVYMYVYIYNNSNIFWIISNLLGGDMWWSPMTCVFSAALILSSQLSRFPNDQNG